MSLIFFPCIRDVIFNRYYNRACARLCVCCACVHLHACVRIRASACVRLNSQTCARTRTRVHADTHSWAHMRLRVVVGAIARVVILRVGVPARLVDIHACTRP